ncbi:MAG TPA: phosphatase PAP2 family protein, partial [Flavisolibacter sp.]|nr:phosphatase PAP2 family protein [Flavisolibacter sp.]
MRNFVLSGLLIFMYTTSYSQKADTLIKKLDSLSKKTDSAGSQKNNINPKAYTEQNEITFSSYFILLGSDLKQEVTAPFHWGKKGWLTFAGFAIAEGALAFADRPIQVQALELRNNHPKLGNVSKYVTNFGGAYEGYILGAFGAYGLIFKSDKVKNTTLLATQAYITGGAMEALIKTLTGRLRPDYYLGTNHSAVGTFEGPFTTAFKKDPFGNRTTSSFPSGHTTVAFAAATVFAMEYKNTPFIPIFAYSAATLIGLSRITENKHWTTDVLAGAMLGYFT